MITLRQKIGQMVLIGFEGTELQDQSPVAQWLMQDGLGGVILFDKDLSTGRYGKNLKNKAQIQRLTHQLKGYAAQSQHYSESGPLLTALDYEGGAVDRLTQIDGCMPTQRAVDLAQCSPAAFDIAVGAMAATLHDLGFNLNFAPVVDLALNTHHGIIGALGRSFSSDPDTVIHMASRFVSIFSHYGIACCYKHFPGHGSAVGDTHEGFVDVTDTFHSDELRPYSILLRDLQSPIMVMTAHVVNTQLDSQGLPATLSHEILTGLLRNIMGYDGVIISDDLHMQAIAHHYTLDEALRLTINAGADMMIFANQLGTSTAPEIIDRIEQLVLTHQISPSRIDEAYRRVLRLKQQIKESELVH